MIAILAEACGWASVAASLYAFNSKTMIPLRIAIVVANVLALAWSGYNHNLPNIALNAILLPLNLLRLREMQRLVSDVKRASRSELDYDWLKPFMRPVEMKAGETLFARGDVADAAFVIGEGQVNLPELGVILGPGALMGEMGLFATGNKRMSGARAMSDVRLYRISYGDFEQLYYQNPEFGLYIVRLMVRRMETNLSRLARPRPGAPPVGEAQPS